MNKYMKEALKEAKLSYNKNEVPVGAVIVKNDKVISKAHNLSYLNGINSHAEILAINDAIKAFNDWRLNDCELYVTLEPCPMCAGAIVQSRIKKVFIGAKTNIKSNSKIIESIFNNNDYYHSVEVKYLDDDNCSKIISNFFKQKR
ncbi:MAG: nucleoside deaminase [Bacilli bacterium]|nr:nucleoside deaminase [Bacilli bacterium]